MKTSSATALRQWLRGSDAYRSRGISEARITSQAQTNVLQLFHEAAQRVPAYRDFLRTQKVEPADIKTIEDFQQVPATSKENYIQKYPAKMRCWDGSFDGMHMISTSSGTTGEVHFWPRDLKTELDGADFHEFIFKHLCHVPPKRTLLINGFAMGNWIAGTFTLACTQLVSLTGSPLTTMTPGYQADAVLSVLKHIAPEFEQVILAGHTPFLKEVIEQAVEQKIPLPKGQLRLLGTGQSITESWRDYMLKLINGQYESQVLNLYGSADAALMGVETPFSIQVRRKLMQNTKLSHELFHDDRLPSLYAYDPRSTYVESLDHELHITKRTGCPLLRYNLHDMGGVYRQSELERLTQLKQNDSHLAPLPLLYLFGREKFMVKIYGANIYTEHVQLAFSLPLLQPLITGRYHLEMTYDDQQNPQLVCRIELTKKTQATQAVRDQIQNVFVTEIAKVNNEYRYVLQEMGVKAKPHIILYSYQDPSYFPAGVMKKHT